MKKILPLLAPLLILPCLTVQAQTSDFVELIPTPYLQTDLTMSAGLGIVSLPKYADDSKQYLQALPILNMQWKSGVFISTVSGFGYNFSADPSWQYGVRLGELAKQRQSALNQDNGPGNVGYTVEPGAFANYLIDQHFSLLSTASIGGGTNNQHNGSLINVGGRYTESVNAQNRVYAILSSTWANGHFMQNYYGVTAEQASTSNLPEYSSKAGIQKVKLAAGWDYAINQHWSLISGGSASEPYGAAKNSPLVAGKVQHVIYTAAYYRF